MNMSKNLYEIITHNLLRASFPKFYNVVLTGRITNRLSIDIYSIDKMLPDLIMANYDAIIFFVGKIIIFFKIKAYAYLPPLIAFLFLGPLLNYVYLRSMRELTRY